MNDDDFMMTPEERRIYKMATTGADQKAKEAEFWGKLIGGGAGAAAGLFSGGSLSMPMMSAGSGIGGMIGNWLGGQQGTELQKQAMNKWESIRAQREEELAKKENRLNSLGLLNSWLKTPGIR